MIRPAPRKSLSRREFRDRIAQYATELDQWIELKVEAFPSDPGARAERLKRIEDPVRGFQVFVETYLPHYVRGEASLFHRAVFDRVPDILHKTGDQGAQDAFIAPRGSSKSTHLSLGMALYAIVRGLKRYIVEVCDVYSQAALLLEAIKSELTTNPRLKSDFPDICGQGRIWREGEFVTRNNIKVDGLGALQKIRGRRHGPYRPDLLFLDDLENDENVKSPEQRQKLQNWINRAALKVGPPDGSMDVIYVGTILHYDSVLARISKSPAWRVTEFRSIMSWPERMDLWETFEEHFHNDGPDAARVFYRANLKAMDKGSVVNWPSIQPLVSLMLIRAEDHASFATEYQNQPISENNPFGSITYWAKREARLIHFGAIDPSLGKRGKGRDPSAILIGGIDPLTGVMDVLEASIRKRLPDLIISDTIELQRIYRCHLWFVEAIQFQEFLRTTLMQRAAKVGVPLMAMPIEPHTDKDLRIERLQVPVKDGLIRLHTAQTTLIEQMQHWPNGDHDDGPDCLDMLYQNAIRYSHGAGDTGNILTSDDGGSGDAGYGGFMEGYLL